jgi:hypothetical protein
MSSPNYSAALNSSKAPSLTKFDFQRGHREDRQNAAGDKSGKKKRERERGGKRVQKKKLNAAQREWAEKVGAPKGPRAQITRGQGPVQTDSTGRRPAERPGDDAFLTSDDEFVDALSDVEVVRGEGSATISIDELTKDLDAASIGKQTPHLDINRNASKHKHAPLGRRYRNKGVRQNEGNNSELLVPGSEARGASGYISTAMIGCPVDFETAKFGPNQELTAFRMTIHGTADWGEISYRSEGPEFNRDSVTNLSIVLTDNQGVCKNYSYYLSPSFPCRGSTSSRTYGTASPSDNTGKR